MIGKYPDKSFYTEDLRGFRNLGGLIPGNLWPSTYLKRLGVPSIVRTTDIRDVMMTIMVLGLLRLIKLKMHKKHLFLLKSDDILI